MQKKFTKRCKKCKRLFDVQKIFWQYSRDVLYYARVQYTQKNFDLCPACIVLKEYKKKQALHDWRVSVAAHNEYWTGRR